MPKISSEVKKIKKICLEALDDMKAQDVSEIDIEKFINGPALTDCKAYDVEQIKKTGTAFYPIN